MYRALALLGCLLLAGVADAQVLQCAQDLNGDGQMDGPGEHALCTNYPGGAMCPIGRAACTRDATGTNVCPLNASRPCIDDGTGQGVAYCSINDCVARSGATPEVIDPPSTTPDDAGPRDAQGNCLGNFQIFPGKALRCRPGGTQTLNRNCCKNRDGVMRDSMGSVADMAMGLKTLSAAARVATAAATGGIAAANQVLATAFDPTTLALTVAVMLVTELLADQCDERDIEAALLNSSKYCVDLGTYCAERWPLVGCVQRARAYCCYNSMLARIIQEQARMQIPSMGGFGTPDTPNCRGFTPEEFQSIDFSKVDMSEYYLELRTKAQQLIEGEVRGRALDSLNP